MIEAVLVGGWVALGRNWVAVAVEVGVGVPVTVGVAEGTAVVILAVSVGKMIETGVSDGVEEARGVRVITLGTQNCCPAFRAVCPLDMQFACCNWAMLTP